MLQKEVQLWIWLQILTLSLKVECYKLTTDVYDPLTSGTVGIILGRSELTSQGCIVHPGIVDGASKT